MRAKSIRLPLPVLAAVDRIYARLPTIACKGECHETCGAVPMTAFEWTRIVVRLGGVPGPRTRDAGGRPWCPMLTGGNRCGVYDVRPLLCRLWGLVDQDGMRCPHGCVPEKWVDRDTANKMLDEISRVSGPFVSAQAEIVYPDVVADLKKQQFLDVGPSPLFDGKNLSVTPVSQAD